MELIPSEPPHFAYVIVLAKRFHFLASRFYKTLDIYRLTDVIDWLLNEWMNEYLFCLQCPVVPSIQIQTHTSPRWLAALNRAASFPLVDSLTTCPGLRQPIFEWALPSNDWILRSPTFFTFFVTFLFPVQSYYPYISVIFLFFSLSFFLRFPYSHFFFFVSFSFCKKIFLFPFFKGGF